MGQFWHKMGCCVLTKSPPRRRRLELSMIGEPTNFTHLTHIGSGEMGEGLPPLSETPGHRHPAPGHVTLHQDTVTLHQDTVTMTDLQATGPEDTQ
ncbi:hypothetical protein CRUP_009352, partial [Coryphaenoides rupestris]